MFFEEFKRQIVDLGANEIEGIRKQYIEVFADTESSTYKKEIAVMHKYIDGYCYLGYLWDCIKCANVIDEEYFTQFEKSDEQVYVFWDIHSCERILSEDYWKFDKNAVLQMSLHLLLENEDFLPEDIYITNKDFTWTLVKTHENIDGKRYCLKSGNI